MSLINFIVREKGVLYGTCVHWRQLLGLFDKKLKGIRYFMMRKKIRIAPYDAGIVIVDFDTRTIFSFHVCFRTDDIDKEAAEWFRKNFNFIDYTKEGLSAMYKELGVVGFEVRD